MQLDAFLIHLDSFFKEFNIDVTPEARSDKLVEEVCEFLEADTKAHADDEAIDVLVCAIANARARGLTDMLHLAFMKLERTAEKYRRNSRVC